jgi:hypothetical protein
MNRANSRGATLIELIVASLLVTLLMGELWMLLQTGSRFYLKARSQSDLQRHALIALRWMSTDLAEGAPLSFRHYDPDNPSMDTERNGFVFGSPKDMDGEVVYDDEGRLSWNSVVGYYIESEGGDLFRVRVPTPEATSSAPQILDEFYSVDVIADAPSKRKVAENAYDIDIVQGIQDVSVKLRFRDEDLGHGLTVRTRLEMKNK